MTTIRTDLGDTRESARRLRVEPTGGITQTNVQKSLEQLDAGKTTKVGTARAPAGGTPIAILTTDTEVEIDTTAAAVSVTLPSAAAWSLANPNGLDLTIIDINGHASTHNITPTLNGSDTFAYGGVTPVITTDFGILKLRPACATGTTTIIGWYIKGVN
jgi:hypothetical protein